MGTEAGETWGEAHRREARARLYQVAAQMVIGGLSFSAACDVAWDSNAATSEPGFRASLKCYASFDATRIDREVRRVRGLAEGRLVRETRWQARVVWPDGSYQAPFNSVDAAESFIAAIDPDNGQPKPVVRVFRVTRIRRASK